MPVTINEPPFKNIEVKPITIGEYTNGDFINCDPETYDYVSKYYYYYINGLIEYTITTNDGTTFEAKGSWFTYNNDYYDLKIIDNQSYENQWIANNTYTIQVALGNITVDEITNPLTGKAINYDEIIENFEKIFSKWKH